MAGPRYTEADIEYIVNNCVKGNYGEIAAHLGRTAYAVQVKAMRLRKAGLEIQMGNHWTKEETEKLHDLWGSCTITEIGRIIGKSHDCVKLKAYREIGTSYEHREYLVAYDVSRIIGTSPTTVYEWIRRGLIKDTTMARGKKHGYKNNHVIRPDQLCAFITKYPYLYEVKNITVPYYRNYAASVKGNTVWLSVDECSRLTGIPASVLRCYIKDGRLKSECLGRVNSKYFITKHNLVEFMHTLDLKRYSNLKLDFLKECGVERS